MTKNQKQKPKIVVYTAIFGKYDGLIPQPRFKNVEYVCFTDQKLKSKAWEIRTVDPKFEDDNTRNNRYYKILPHIHFQDYEISIYVDGNFVLKRNPEELIEKVGDFDMLTFDHNQTKSDSRDCIYKEYEAIIRLGEETGKFKDDPEIMRRQIERFKKEGYPVNNGLISAGVMIRRHHFDKVRATMDTWWKVVSKESKRDLLSFNYAAWKNNLKYAVIDGDIRVDNPWFHMIGVHRADYSRKYFRYRLKRLVGLIQ